MPALVKKTLGSSRGTSGGHPPRTERHRRARPLRYEGRGGRGDPRGAEQARTPDDGAHRRGDAEGDEREGHDGRRHGYRSAPGGPARMVNAPERRAVSAARSPVGMRAMAASANRGSRKK